jgi:hypothetical protein
VRVVNTTLSIFCATPFSRSSKSAGRRFVMGRPCLSVTIASTRTVWRGESGVAESDDAGVAATGGVGAAAGAI